MTRSRVDVRWLLAAALIILATLGVLFAPAAQAAEGALEADIQPQLPAVQPDQRIFNEDLLVADGQVINDNVAVLNGDVTIRSGGIIAGNLSVVRGDVEVAGQIRGDLSVVQGDADLRSSARVSGNVSIVGGKVERQEGAWVGGNFLGGRNSDWENWFDGDNGSEIEGAGPFRERGVQRPWLAVFFWRLLQAVLWTLLITGLVVLVIWLAPAQVKGVAATVETEPALSFAVGAVVTLVVSFLSMGLFATLCLAPAGLLLTALLAAAGLLGWAATAHLLGEKLVALGQGGAAERIPGLVYAAVTALVLTGLTMFSWALLACIGFVVGLLLIAPGVGAVLVNLARRTRGDRPPAAAAPSAAASSAGNDAATSDDTPAGAPQSAPSDTSDVTPDVTGTGDGGTQFASGDDLGLTDEERRALQRGAGVAPAASDGEPADFTQLKGIGPAFDRRLKEAGITTFAALAALTPEEASAIIGWPPERVVRDQLLEQAAALAEE